MRQCCMSDIVSEANWGFFFYYRARRKLSKHLLRSRELLNGYGNHRLS